MRDDLGRRVVEARNIVEQLVVDLPDQRPYRSVDFGEVLDEASRVDHAANDDLDAVVVPMKVAALVAFRTRGR